MFPMLPATHNCNKDMSSSEFCFHLQLQFHEDIRDIVLACFYDLEIHSAREREYRLTVIRVLKDNAAR